MIYNNIKVLIFATDKFKDSQKKLIKHLDSIGVKNIIELSEKNLPNEFIEEHKNHFSKKRGFGYWIWKPYIIIQELNKLQDDEILLYIDSTDLPKQTFFDLVIKHFTHNEILLINQNKYFHGDWTKRDCFVLMDCDKEKYYNELQLEAGVIGVKNNQLCLNILNEWFFFMKNLSILDDSPNTQGLPNLYNFKEHRHDQSILTNLSIKMNIKSIKVDSNLIRFNYNQPIN
jgi:hypothetical protein